MHKKLIYLAGGCFWGVEKFLKGLNGVISTEVGYANGFGSAPTYQEVCQGNCEFVECVRVEYQGGYITLKQLLDSFFMVIDPTSLNKQGNDIGVQYRTGIYYIDANDQLIIQKALDKLQTSYKQSIVVECLPLKNFYLAEEYHQDYLIKNPSGYCHISGHLLKKNN